MVPILRTNFGTPVLVVPPRASAVKLSAGNELRRRLNA